MTMQTAFRKSKALWSLLPPISLLPSGATYANEGLLAARLFSIVTDRAHSSDIRDIPIVVQQSLPTWWSGNLVRRYMMSDLCVVHPRALNLSD